MFCAYCGKEIEDTVSFCPKCGTKVADGTSSISNQTVPISESQPDIQMTQVMPTTRTMNAAEVLSIIGFIWFSLWTIIFPSIISPIIIIIIGDLPDDERWAQHGGAGIFIAGYALAHAIVALVQANKHKIKPIKTMAILSIVWSGIAFLIIGGSSSTYTWEAAQGLPVYGLGIYALAFSIVTFVQSRKKIPGGVQ